MSSCAVWTSYIEIGATAYRSGHDAIADKMVRAAIEETPKKEESFGQLLIALENLGDYLHIDGRHSKAEKLYKRAKSLHLKIKSDDNADVCRILYKLAKLYVVDNRHAIARRAFAQAFLATKKCFVVHIDEHEKYLTELSNLWIERGKKEEAMLVYNELIALQHSRSK